MERNKKQSTSRKCSASKLKKSHDTPRKNGVWVWVLGYIPFDFATTRSTEQWKLRSSSFNFEFEYASNPWTANLLSPFRPSPYATLLVYRTSIMPSMVNRDYQAIPNCDDEPELGFHDGFNLRGSMTSSSPMRKVAYFFAIIASICVVAVLATLKGANGVVARSQGTAFVISSGTFGGIFQLHTSIRKNSFEDLNFLV